MMAASTLGIRWTIGDVSVEGFEALRLSILGAYRIFRRTAAYAVCVNCVPVSYAQDMTGDLPVPVSWIESSVKLLPDWLSPRFDRGMAQGVAWKFAPLRVFPGCYELSFDNDCILWELPEPLRRALHAKPQRCVLAEDASTCLGQFAKLCGPEPRNSGIRGTPSNFDLAGSLRNVLERCNCRLNAETDEQGLQVAALTVHASPEIVRIGDVSICSPFPPHSSTLGECGAHFMGLNAHQLPWKYYSRPASDVRREHWYGLRESVLEHVTRPPREPMPARTGLARLP
jgi:hypothetical protein